MGFVIRSHLAVLLAVLAMAVVMAESSSFGSIKASGFDLPFSKCNGRVGDCIDESEEMMLDSESNRRLLAQSRRISYGALNKNNVPCNQRGSSYYNCGSHQAVNPYSRGCTRISRCTRNTK
ncbi:OLC1v1021497C1 [Oldenlandia corymbosa var. corymbosa]|uniref:OLC1v1021497C1 n=1 Tax=Oldenlandia corymbosa var. corymbosa TaxID=529605 RepID=A0AAV1BVT6_OLDCO|nr:OLC1v1021497C1 [Oldenlandia corymbosa var. corymbosa]